jgi:hypothetical protein
MLNALGQHTSCPGLQGDNHLAAAAETSRQTSRLSRTLSQCGSSVPAALSFIVSLNLIAGRQVVIYAIIPEKDAILCLVFAIFRAFETHLLRYLDKYVHLGYSPRHGAANPMVFCSSQAEKEGLAA